MRSLSLFFALCSIATSVAAREPLTNVVYATADKAGNTTTGYVCTATPGVPYACCTSAGAGNCQNVLNGADIAVALEECEGDATLCVVQLMPGVYEQAENDITALGGGGSGTNQRAGQGYTNGFPGGLIIQGYGDSTIVQSSIPPRVISGGSAAIFQVALTPNMNQTEAPSFTFQNFRCDGQMNLQPSYANGFMCGQGDTSCANDQEVANDHSCIATAGGSSTWSILQGVPKLKIRHLRIEDFHDSGIGIGTQFSSPSRIGAGRAIVDGNIIEHIGCVQSQTALQMDEMCFGNKNPLVTCDGNGSSTSPGVAAELPCGCDAPGHESNCYGWNDELNMYQGGTQPGQKREGSGINVGLGSWTHITNNYFAFISKYGITGWTQDCMDRTTYDDFSMGSCGAPIYAKGNRFHRVNMPLATHGAWKAVFSDNIIGTSYISPHFCQTCGYGMTSVGVWYRRIELRDNIFKGVPYHEVVRLMTWQPSPAQAGPAFKNGPVWIEGNQIELDCGFCARDGAGPCTGITLSARLAGDAPQGTYLPDIQNVVLKDNVITNGTATGCTVGLVAQFYDRLSFDPDWGTIRNMTVVGGDYDATPCFHSGFSDGNGFTCAADGPAVAYFNWVENLKMGNVVCTEVGKPFPCCTGPAAGSCGPTVRDGKWTLGRGTNQDFMTGGACSGFVKTGSPTGSVVDAYGIFGTCN